MPIRTPSERAYYPASHDEIDELLCWIPAEEYEWMTAQHQLSVAVPADYPDGIEVEVSEVDFAAVGLDVGVTAEAISMAYRRLRTSGKLPDSGYVNGRALERAAQQLSMSASAATDVPESLDRLGIPELPEPEMTDGDDPLDVMRRLA